MTWQRVVRACAAVAGVLVCGCHTASPESTSYPAAARRGFVPGASAGGYVVWVHRDASGSACATLAPRVIPIQIGLGDFGTGCLDEKFVVTHDRTPDGQDVLWGIPPANTKFVVLFSNGKALATGTASSANSNSSFLVLVDSLPGTYQVVALNAHHDVIGEMPSSAVPPMVPCLPAIRAVHRAAGQASGGLCELVL